MVQLRRRVATLICAALLCVGLCPRAVALSLDAPLRELRHTGWGAKEGAPGTNVIVQTSDGYLWLGGSEGLFRFDGLRFERYPLPRDPRIGSIVIFHMFAPASGGLWIGFTLGGAAFLKDGQLTAYNDTDGLPQGSVSGFASGPDGTVWAATTAGGLARLSGSRWQAIDASWQHTAPGVPTLMIDSQGALWSASNSALFVLPKGEKVFRRLPVQLTGHAALAESPTGAVWAMDEAGLRQVAQNPNSSGRTASSRHGLMFDRDGALWAKSTANELRRVARPESLAQTSLLRLQDLPDVATARDGLKAGASYAALLEDREGNIWVAGRLGVDRYSERNVAPLFTAANDLGASLIAGNAAFAAADQGAVWITQSHPGVLHGLQGDQLTRHEAVRDASCALRTADGAVWFGGSAGLWRYALGRFERKNPPEGMADVDVQAMAEDAAGGLWVSFSLKNRGAFRLANGVWSAEYGGLADLPPSRAVALSTDALGRVWFGYTQGRVAAVEGTKVRAFMAQGAGPKIGTVTSIYSQRKHVWFGGDFGLARFDGTGFQTITPAAGVVLGSITGIVETAAGDLWVNGAAGLSRITAAEAALAIADPQHRVLTDTFDTLDGVEGTAARLRPLPSLIEGTDGRLWFATSAGIYSLAPAHLFRNAMPPPVSIQSVTADGEAYTPQADLKLPPRTKSLQINYVGLSLTMSEKVRYRYQLEGVDAGWQDASSRRQAAYTNLAPGTYRFRVIASNNDGTWNDTGASLNVSIPPTFVQTGWFVALCVAAGGLALGLLFRIRVAQIAARTRERFEARLAERERIARELHDTLLQSTQSLVLRFQSVANGLPRDHPSRELMNATLDSADAVMAEGRDRVLDLRVPADSLAELPQALAAVGEELMKTHPSLFNTVVEGHPRRLERRAMDEAYRIGREALINAFHHAHARSIEVQIVYGANDLRLHIRDDGRGIDAPTFGSGARPGHWGLMGMRERASALGAQIQVWSKPDAGTEVELVVPASAAYEPSTDLPWWRLLRRSALVGH